MSFAGSESLILLLQECRMNRIVARIAGIYLLTFAIVGVKSAGAQQQSVYIEPSQPLLRQLVQVPAGRFAAFDFTLTRGSSLTARFNVRGGIDNKIKVWLLDATNYQLFQARRQFSYFSGTSGKLAAAQDNWDRRWLCARCSHQWEAAA
jgi:hypothetical protein